MDNLSFHPRAGLKKGCGGQDANPMPAQLKRRVCHLFGELWLEQWGKWSDQALDHRRGSTPTQHAPAVLPCRGINHRTIWLHPSFPLATRLPIHSTSISLTTVLPRGRPSTIQHLKHLSTPPLPDSHSDLKTHIDSPVLERPSEHPRHHHRPTFQKRLYGNYHTNVPCSCALPRLLSLPVPMYLQT